jgi:hypothetical protein
MVEKPGHGLVGGAERYAAHSGLTVHAEAHLHLAFRHAEEGPVTWNRLG